MKKICALLTLVLFAAPTVGQERIIGGRLAEEGEFPEVVRVSNGCTATLVGPSVILTAAHCTTGSDSSLSFVVDGKTYRSKCTAGGGPGGLDMSLCKVDEPVVGITPALIKGSVANGTKVTIAGCGCTVWMSQTDGRLRVGNAAVVSTSNVSMTMRNGAAICPGDSGGPTFLRIENAFEELHYLVGVNSQGDGTSSYNPRADTQEAHDFFTSWSKKNGDVEICGVTSDCL